MKKIAIITVDYNNHKDTSELLASRQKLKIKGFETLWLAVDNGSDISIKDSIKDFKDVTWMQTGRNLGFAGGYNRGMRYAYEWGADFLLIINNDTLFNDPDLIQKLSDVLSRNKEAGVVSPKIYFAPGYEFYKQRYKSTDKGQVIWYAGGDFDWNNVRSIHRGIDQVDDGKYGKTEKTNFVSGCCLMVRREVLEKAGYFNEQLFAYFEDNDWMQRIVGAGFELWYCGNTSIFHKVGRTAGIGSSWSDYMLTRNRLWFGMKYSGLRTKFALAREAARFLLNGRPAQKEGVIDFLRHVHGGKDARQPVKALYPYKLSIISVNYKTTGYTLKLLKSIYSNKSGINNIKGGAEVLILDNSPDEPCRKEVTTKFPQVRFFSNEKNSGFSKGNNKLIDLALGENILLLNSDIEVKEDAITHMLEALGKYGDRSIYAGKLYYPDGSEQESVFKLPTVWGAFSYYFLGKKENYFINVPRYTKITRVEGAVMASFLIPRKVINEIGKLEEETFTNYEDVDYCRRAKAENIPVYFVPEAGFIHYLRKASEADGKVKYNERLVKAAKWYHGLPEYSLITFILWAGQKWHKLLRMFANKTDQ